MLYCLNQEAKNTAFLIPTSSDVTWKMNDPYPGLTDDTAGNKTKKEEKLFNLTSMLGYISQFVPHYLSSDIVNNSTSINDIWAIICKYDGLQQSEEKQVADDEMFSPTVERLAVLRWMELLHTKLPALIAGTFAYDLQCMTLKDIQPQIADGIENFLEERRRCTDTSFQDIHQ